MCTETATHCLVMNSEQQISSSSINKGKEFQFQEKRKKGGYNNLTPDVLNESATQMTDLMFWNSNTVSLLLKPLQPLTLVYPFFPNCNKERQHRSQENFSFSPRACYQFCFANNACSMIQVKLSGRQQTFGRLLLLYQTVYAPVTWREKQSWHSNLLSLSRENPSHSQRIDKREEKRDAHQQGIDSKRVNCSTLYPCSMCAVHSSQFVSRAIFLASSWTAH